MLVCSMLHIPEHYVSSLCFTPVVMGAAYPQAAYPIIPPLINTRPLLYCEDSPPKKCAQGVHFPESRDSLVLTSDLFLPGLQ